ncbi:sigma-70 family RNA polymerase sigma factor [Flavobacterium gelidilacus]
MNYYLSTKRAKKISILVTTFTFGILIDMNPESEELFVKQLQENQNIIHKICRLYTSDDDSHKDLFQEITIQLWKAFPKFRGDSKFTTWAYRVGLNTAITLYRKKKRTIDTIEFNNTYHRVKQEDYNFEEEEQLKLLYSAVDQLNDIEKALVFLYIEDKDYAEISETLGISEVNARVKMNRVKGKLKKILNP